MLKLTNKFGNTCPVPFMGWGERLGICELEKAPEMQKCTRSFVHDCRFNVPKIDIILTDVIVMWLFLILDAAPAKKSRKKKKAGPLSRPIICICNDQWVQELLGHDSMDKITSYRSVRSIFNVNDVTWMCLRWPKPIYMHNGYVFELSLTLSAGKN